MRCTDLDKIRISRYAWYPTKPNTVNLPDAGLDTETQDGTAFTIGFDTEDDKGIFYLTKENLLDVLYIMMKKLYRHTCWFYNLGYDVRAISKLLPYDKLVELTRWGRCEHEGFSFRYLEDKMFKVTKGKYRLLCYDLAQFYNYMKLDTAAKKYLDDKKDSLEGIDISSLSSSRYLSDYEYRMTVDRYLAQDCMLTRMLAEKFMDLISDFMIPKRFYSQASLAEQYYRENAEEYNVLPPRPVMSLALKAYHGGRFEVLKRGMIKGVKIYDLKSAYPAVNKDLPLMFGRWKKNKVYDKAADLAVYDCDIDIKDTQIGPLPMRIGQRMVYPIGKRKSVCMMKCEIEYLMKKGHSVKINEAWHFYKNSDKRPFSFLEEFYNMKENLKRQGKDDMAMLPKIIINGFYGKLIQVTPKQWFTKAYDQDDEIVDIFTDEEGSYTYIVRRYSAGKIFNPLYAAEITARTRIRLCEAADEVGEDNVVGFATDSIMISGCKGLATGRTLGDWELEKEGDMVILGSGVYQLIGQKVRMRGFGKGLEFVSMLPGADTVLPVKLKRVKTNKGMLSRKLSDEERYAMMNTFIEEQRGLDLNFDIKRRWKRDFISGDDVLRSCILSKPLDAERLDDA